MSHPFDKSDIEATARRALIAVDPAYHSWSHEQQEIFRATMDGDARYRIRRSLLASLRGIERNSEKDIDDVWEVVSNSDFYSLNWAKLLTSKRIEGENNGERQGEGFIWDMRTDANGLEGQLDELKRRWWAYQNERREVLGEALSSWPAAVHKKEEDWDDDPSRTFIFTNGESLKRIRWKHFLSDCASLLIPLYDNDDLLKREVELAIAFLDEAHQDIIENFDPKVIRF